MVSYLKEKLAHAFDKFLGCELNLDHTGPCCVGGVRVPASPEFLELMEWVGTWRMK